MGLLTAKRIECNQHRPFLQSGAEYQKMNTRRYARNKPSLHITHAGRSGNLPPKPTTRSTNSNQEESLSATLQHHQANTMAEHTNVESTQPAPNDRKLVVKVPEELLTSLRTSCAENANVSLLGRIQGKHPGLKALTAWARDTLHPSLAFLSLKANNLFEITFSTPEGRIHALT